MIPLNEFKEVFAEDRLYREVFWYCGSKDGFAYVLWEQTTKTPHDNPINADIHTNLYRYRVDESQVVFTSQFTFEGYGYGNQRKRIVPMRHADHDSVAYRIVE